MSYDPFLVILGITMAVLGAITWTQTRFGAMRYPTLTKVLFWVLHIALLGSTSFQGALSFVLPKPRRYIDYPEFMETNFLMSTWLGFLSQAALLGLFVPVAVVDHGKIACKVKLRFG